MCPLRQKLKVKFEGCRVRGFRTQRQLIGWSSRLQGPPIAYRVKLANVVKGKLQRKNKLISHERAFKMLENDIYIAGIGQAVLELLSFKVGSGIHQWESPYFRNFR